RSGTTRLKGGGQAAPRAAVAQHQIQHRNRLAEKRIIPIPYRVARAGMIEKIEADEANLKRRRIAYGNTPAQSRIGLEHSKTGDGISPQAALHSNRRTKSLRIQPSSTGHRGVRNPNGSTCDQIGPAVVVPAKPQRILGLQDVDRKSRARSRDRLYSPATRRCEAHRTRKGVPRVER